jgi:phosphatidylserine/phosphatidylglycerophosphate/cardiolipin synthase-like enzyme
LRIEEKLQLNKSNLLILLLISVYSFHLKSQEIQTYFNYNLNNYYFDPYRNFERQGDDLEEVIIETISKARSHVYIAIQELRLPRIAKKLVELSTSGIEVRVVIENNYNNTILDLADITPFPQNDHNTSRYLELYNFIDINGDGDIDQKELSARDAIYMLNQSNILIVDDTADDSYGSGLMHHKFIVVDNDTTILSTANFTLSGIHGDFSVPESRGNPNSLMVIKSKKLNQIFAEEFNIMWGETELSRFGKNKPYRGVQEVKLKHASLKVQFSPTSKAQDFEETVNGLIAREITKTSSATKMALFVFSDQRIANALKDRYENISHYDLGLILEPKFAYRNYSELLDMWGLTLLNDQCEDEYKNNPWIRKPFMGAGVSNLLSSDVLHHKFAVLDKNKVIMGSHNWSSSANYSNDEFLIIINSENVADHYLQEYERLARNIRKGPPKSLLRRIKLREDTCTY